MTISHEKVSRFFARFLLMLTPFILAGSYPVTAFGQTTVIAAEKSAGLLLARFHPPPPKIKKPPKPPPPPPPPHKVTVPPVLNLSVSNAERILRGRVCPLTSRAGKSRPGGEASTTPWHGRTRPPAGSSAEGQASSSPYIATRSPLPR